MDYHDKLCEAVREVWGDDAAVLITLPTGAQRDWCVRVVVLDEGKLDLDRTKLVRRSPTCRDAVRLLTEAVLALRAVRARSGTVIAEGC